jgi:hypothetical protein
MAEKANKKMERRVISDGYLDEFWRKRSPGSRCPDELKELLRQTIRLRRIVANGDDTVPLNRGKQKESAG